MHSIRNTHRGFTLIELLVVIAIIAILSAVALASLLTSREKSRDANRISEVKEIRKALDLYFDNTSGGTVQSYPPTIGNYLPSDATNYTNATVRTAFLKFLPKQPTTLSGRNYYYMGLSGDPGNFSSCVASPCNNFVVYVQLERGDSFALRQDADVAVSGVFNGNSVACNATAGTPQPTSAANGELCYDIVP